MEIKSIRGDVIYTSVALSLREAVLDATGKKANLSGVNLYGANLSGVNLYGANLSGANLSRANLSRADLSGADLYEANLSGVDLSRANLSRADLSGADLSGADLYEANLSGVDLYGANLSGVNLYGANLSGASKADVALARIQFLPEEGSFIGWKKCYGGVIVKLQITENAKRSHGTERKARCSEALVLEVIEADVARSGGGYSVVEYHKGEIVRPDAWDENRWKVCSNGIHFFLTRAEAEAYTL